MNAISQPRPRIGACSTQGNRLSRHGFTLVELMVVVAMIGLLAAIALPNFARARQASLLTRFAADLRTATDAFVEYAAENGNYPEDGMPGGMPSGMGPYLSKMHWSGTTPLGGQWDWDNNQFGFKAGVSVYQPTVPDSQMRRLDTLIDDGNLGSGSFRARSDGYISIIEP